MDTIDLIRKIKLTRKYILDQEYEQAYNETYLPPEVEESNSLPVEAGVIKTEADTVDTISANERAKRWAVMGFDNWNEVTGFVDSNNSYYDEITSLIEDAVDYGYGVAHKKSLKEIIKVIKKSEGDRAL